MSNSLFELRPEIDRHSEYIDQLQRDTCALRQDFVDLKLDLIESVETNRADIRRGTAEVRADIKRLSSRQFWIFSAMITIYSITIAASVILLK